MNNKKIIKARFAISAEDFAKACAVLSGVKPEMKYSDGHIIANVGSVEVRQGDDFWHDLTITHDGLLMSTNIRIDDTHTEAVSGMDGFDKKWTAVLTAIGEEFGGVFIGGIHEWAVMGKPLRTDCDIRDAVQDRINDLRLRPAFMIDDFARTFVIGDKVRHIEKNYREGNVGVIYSFYGGAPRIGYPEGSTGRPDKLLDLEILE